MLWGWGPTGGLLLTEAERFKLILGETNPARKLEVGALGPHRDLSHAGNSKACVQGWRPV